MKPFDQFFDHAIENLSVRLGTSANDAGRFVEYIAATGCIEKKAALSIAKKADSPSTKKIIKLLNLDKEEDEASGPEPVDEAHVKQHDYRPTTIHSPSTEPATPNYSLFSVPAGFPINANRTTDGSTNKIASARMVAPPLSKKAITINTIEITEEEKAQAVETRKRYEEMIDSMNHAFEHLNTLNGALGGISDSTELEPLRKLFKQYKRRTQEMFNEFIDCLEAALLAANKTVRDSEADRLQDTIVAEVREIRDGVQNILVFLKEPQAPDFIKDFTSTVERLNARRKSLDEVVSDGLFSHIDADILGLVRLG